MVSPSEALPVDQVERGREDLVARRCAPLALRFVCARYLTWSVSYFIMPYISTVQGTTAASGERMPAAPAMGEAQREGT